MIGTVEYSLGGAPAVATLGDDGVWADPNAVVAGVLNTFCPASAYSPADGAFGLHALAQGADYLGGVARPAPRQATPPKGAVFALDRAVFGGGAVEAPSSEIWFWGPPVPQSHDYSCGAAELAFVCAAWGIGLRLPPGMSFPKGIEEFCIKKAKTSPEDGTTPEHLAEAARGLGLKVLDAREGMTQADLAACRAGGNPVICCIQAWGHHPDGYATDEDDGHYVTVIGMGPDNVWEHDSSLPRPLAYTPRDKWDLRWHDRDASGKTYTHWGLVLGRPDQARAQPTR